MEERVMMGERWERGLCVQNFNEKRWKIEKTAKF
jgi:hypothetical protein